MAYTPYKCKGLQVNFQLAAALHVNQSRGDTSGCDTIQLFAAHSMTEDELHLRGDENSMETLGKIQLPRPFLDHHPRVKVVQEGHQLTFGVCNRDCRAAAA